MNSCPKNLYCNKEKVHVSSCHITLRTNAIASYPLWCDDQRSTRSCPLAHPWLQILSSWEKDLLHPSSKHKCLRRCSSRTPWSPPNMEWPTQHVASKWIVLHPMGNYFNIFWSLNLVVDVAKKNTWHQCTIFSVRGSNYIHAPTYTWIKYTFNHISTDFYTLILGVHCIFTLVAYECTKRVKSYI
jgi:hypothetical protein